MEHSKKFRLALCGTVTLIVIAAATIHQYLVSENDIPLPFGNEQSSSLSGDLTKIGHKKYDFFRVTFPVGVDSETLVPDTIYLVSVPSDESIETVMLDQALTASGSHDVNYFGYKYVSADSATEKAHKNDSLLKDKFPGQFFASAKAKALDAAHGNALANFEAAHGIVLAATGTEDGVLLTPNSLYFLILNETGTLTVRVPDQIIDTGGVSGNVGDNNAGSGDTVTDSSVQPLCGNGVTEAPETCDDGQNNTNDCTPEEGGTCSFCFVDTCTTVAKQG